jgi:hypothetical protein
MSATCPTHLLHLHHNVWWLYESWRSSCNLLHPPVTSSLLGPDMFLTSYSRTPWAYLSRTVDQYLHTHVQRQAKLLSLNFNLCVCW